MFDKPHWNLRFQVWPAYYYSDDVIVFHNRCEDILPMISEGEVDLLCTDPPYGIGLKTDYAAQGRKSANNWERIEGDSKPFDPSHLLRFKRKIIFGGNYFADKLPISGGWIVWDKLDGLESKRAKEEDNLYTFADNSDGELAWTNLGEGLRIVRHRWTGMLKGSEREKKRLHPTQKPVALMTRLILAYTKPGDLVLDPYGGSGSTAVACRNTGRYCVTIEMHEPYCKVIATRLQQQSLGLLFEDE